MTAVVTRPRHRRARCPPLDVDPAGIRRFARRPARRVRAGRRPRRASSPARPGSGDWTGRRRHGVPRRDPADRSPGGRDVAGAAQRRPTRRRARRRDRGRCATRRETLVGERADLVAAIAGLRAGIDGAPADGRPRAAGRRRRPAPAGPGPSRPTLDRWVTDLIAEEEAMRAAFTRCSPSTRSSGGTAALPDPADERCDRSRRAGASSGRGLRVVGRAHPRRSSRRSSPRRPGSIGNLDGIPPRARDAANTVALDRDLADWGDLEDQGVLTDDERQWLGNARAAQDALDAIEGGVDPVTRDADPGPGLPLRPGRLRRRRRRRGLRRRPRHRRQRRGRRARLRHRRRERGLPGRPRRSTSTRPAGSVDGTGERRDDVLDRLRRPRQPAVGRRGLGRRRRGRRGHGRPPAATGSPTCSTGLRESRDGDPAHLTAIGHSYGSTTTGHAAHDHGLPVDDLVVVGSPGLGGDVDNADDLGVDPDHVWAGVNSRDPVAYLADHGWVDLE